MQIMESSALLCHPRGRAATAILLAVTLCVLALAAPSEAFKTSFSKNAVHTVPLFEQFFAQPFQVSVLTQSFGAFNATLRMRASLNFPERVQGELIPIGKPKLDRRRQTPLPHFQRARSIEDDMLSDLPFSVAVGSGHTNKKKSGTRESGSRDLAFAGEEEHPSLLIVDLHLKHSDAMEGAASVYYLPPELKALRAQREGMREGSVPPSATVEFAFRSEVGHMTGNPLSDVSDFAYVSSAVVTSSYNNASRTARAADKEVHGSPAAAASQGGIIFRWVTEHEFSAHVAISILIVDEVGSALTRMERIWVYGYATPSKSLYDRKQSEVPWYSKYVMLGAGLMGFVVQVVSGMTEGRKRAQEKAELEAPLLEQEGSNKKKR